MSEVTPGHAAFRRFHAVRWPDQTAELSDRAWAVQGDKAKAAWEAAGTPPELAEYENAITWGTSCLSCARILDSAYAETVRAERAEAKLSRIREGMANFLAEYGNSGIPVFKVAQDLAGSTVKILDGRDGAGPVESPETAAQAVARIPEGGQ